MNDKTARNEHLWGIYYKGKLWCGFAWGLRSTRARAKMMFLNERQHFFKTWEQCRAQGYSCRKVTIKEGWE